VPGLYLCLPGGRIRPSVPSVMLVTGFAVASQIANHCQGQKCCFKKFSYSWVNVCDNM